MTEYPKTVNICFTTKCNYQCFFCNRENFTTSEMDFENLKKLEPLIRNCDILDITGWGEPLLYPKIKEVIEYVNKINKKGIIRLATNGVLLRGEIASLIAENLNFITISVSAGKEEEYDKFINPGTWKKVLENIKSFSEKVPEKRSVINLTFVAHQGNINSFPDFVRLANELGAGRVLFSHLIVTKKENFYSSLWFNQKISDEKLREGIEIGKQFGIEVDGRFFEDDLPPPTEKCNYPFTDIHIGTNGFVSPCCFAGNQNMGNIFAEGIIHIWEGEKYQKLRQNRYFPECSICRAFTPIKELKSHITPSLYDYFLKEKKELF